jgi:hypothetical protein
MNEHTFKLFITKNFAKALQEEFTVYTFIMCNIIEESTVEHQVKVMNNATSHFTNTFKMQILSVELKEYKDVFLTESINRLSLHEEHNHAIKIIAELLYNSLYNLSNTEFMILKQYLNNVLMKE